MFTFTALTQISFTTSDRCADAGYSQENSYADLFWQLACWCDARVFVGEDGL